MSERVQPEPVAAGLTGDSPSGWLLEIAAASRSVEAQADPRRRSPLGWGSRRATRARRQLVRQEIMGTAGVEPAEPVEPVATAEAVDAVEQRPLLEVLVERAATVPDAFPRDLAAARLPVAPEPEPAEVEPLLERIGAYTAKPARLIVH